MEMKAYTTERNIKLLLIGVVLIASTAAGTASAQWKVIDEQLIQDSKGQWKEENKQREKANESLKAMQTIGKHESAGEKPKEPDEKLNAEQPSATVNLSISERCPTPSAVAGAVLKQHQLCQEIVKTQMAKYKYALKMYELTNERYKRLEDIQKQRGQIKDTEQGKLQDNNNKLLALISLMEIDRQQQKTYMDAYDARLTYLVAARDLLTQKALGGSKGDDGLGIGGPISGIIGGGALKLALEAVKTRRRHDF
jgi:hypothetical protein